MEDSPTEWCTAAVEPGDLGPGWIEVADHFAPRLLTEHHLELEAVACETKLGTERLTREIPDSSASLGQDGLIAVGTLVRPGDVLVGKLTPLARKEEGYRDTSLRVPPGLEGEVLEAILLEPAKGEPARARVVLRWESPLAVGDQLVVEGDERPLTVCTIRPMAADARLDGPGGEARLAKAQLARDVIHARSIGPYSLVTQQPLSGHDACGGQLATVDLARALVAGGCRWLLGELYTVKADDVGGRMRAFEALVGGRDPDPWAGPGPTDLFALLNGTAPEGDGVASIEAAKVLRAELAALCFDVGWQEGADGQSVEVRARLLGDAEIRQRSRGEVKTPETINYRTLRCEPNGLFCCRIFGPVRDDECLCGKLRGLEHRGQTCDVCGVEATRSAVRRERFGHVELAAPVLHPLFVEEVALLLGREAEEIAAIARGEANLGDQTGGLALEAALAELDLEALEATEAGDRAELAWAMLQANLSPTAFVLHALPVLPVDLRPLVPLEGGRFATSDLNDLYRRVINRNNRTKRLLELLAPEMIIRNEIGQLFQAVAHLFANGRDGRRMTGPDSRPLKSLLDMIEGSRQLTLLSKRVDYSGAAMLVVDPTLGPGQCRLPESMARELFKPWAYHRLEAEGHVTTIKQARDAVKAAAPEALAALAASADGYPVILARGARVVGRRVLVWDHPAIGVDAATAEALGGGGEVHVHVPLSEQARKECASLPDCPAPAPLEPSGWFSEVFADGDLPRLLRRAALHDEVERLGDEAIRLALGHRPSTG